MRAYKTVVRWITMRRGFTLVEMLIAVLISFIILAAIFEVFIAQKRRYVNEDAVLEMENRGDFAIEYLTRIIQNSGYNIQQGMKFEAASDHYFVTAMDENNDNVIGPEEIVAISLNKSTREIGAGDQPTELVRDPDMDDFTAGKRSFGFDASFDMDGDGTVSDTERFVSGYNLNTPRNDASLDQKDSIKLFLSDGPPYAVYRYSFSLLDDGDAYNAATNPYIVKPSPDLIAGDVDNFIIRYYDEENLPLPVTSDDAGRRITPKPPYILTRSDLTRIRRVEFEVLLRSTRVDSKWTDTGSYPAGSVATYDSDGKPAGWSCGDAEFRGAEPYLTSCAGLSDWDCFYRYCNNKVYPTLANNKVDYQDQYHRLLLTSSVTPKNLVLNPYGQLTLTVDPPKIRCPDTEATLTATLRDREGKPIEDAVVNFYSTSEVSALDYTAVSDHNADGDPITNEDGIVTGITLKAVALAGGKKKPTTVTVSADTAITVTVDGVDRSIPIYSSVVVPFVVGPPLTIELKNPTPDTTACKEAAVETFTLEAKDCNGFPSEGATITVNPYDPITSSTAFVGDAGIDWGSFHNKKDRDAATLIPVTPTNPAAMVDYSDNSDDDGKYAIYYGSPMISDAQYGTKTYFSPLGFVFKVTKFDEKNLTDPVPNGWGYADDPEVTHTFTINPGSVARIDASPTTYSGTGCEDGYFDIYGVGRDCAAVNTWSNYSIWASILNSVGHRAPPDPVGSIMGTLENLTGTGLGVYNAKMVWDTDRQKYRLIFVNTGCAVSNTGESVEMLNYDLGGTPPTVTATGTLGVNLSQCPTGLHITLKAREPHTSDCSGTLTDGFYQNGCNYNNIDVVANVILNIPPSTVCADVPLNPVTFTVVSGGAKFLDGSGNPTLTTKTVNTNSSGMAFTGLKLTTTSLADVVIRATSSTGSSPVYTDTVTITFPVGEDHIVFAYRDSCYKDLLTPANGLRTDDYMYLEVRDCNRNDSTSTADTTTATVYTFLSAVTDSETVTLTETGNDTGIFRGKLKTRALPPGWSSANNDTVLDILNGSYVNVRYQDEDLNDFYAYDGYNIPTILDQCNEGIRFVENFAKTSYDGITSNMTNFVLADPASWRAFSSLNVTRRTTTPTITPSASWIKYLLLQFCDEMFLSGSIYSQYFYNGSAVSFPPSSTPAVKWRNVESFMWVDLDEDTVGVHASEQNWEDLAVSYRFKTVGDPADAGYGSTTATIGDYYLPGITKGVYFLFRTASSNVTMTGLSGTPTMDVIDRGYIAVWTEDASGNPLARLYRVDGIDNDANPITVDVVQMGGDITGTDFDIPFDDGEYHKAEIVLDGNDFYIYFDDVLLDFDGQSGPSAVGGASVIDKNYTTGSIGFGVKDVIAKFDNIQVCGCAPMTIVSSNTSYPQGTPVTLTMKDQIYGMNAPGPVDWNVVPAGDGTFSENPSTGPSVIFTRSYFSDFPSEFDAMDALGCIATIVTPAPPATCVTQNFDSGTWPFVSPNDFDQWVGTWTVAADSGNGNNKGLHYSGSVSGVKLIRAVGTAYSAVYNNNSVDLYDDYDAEVYVRPTNVSSGSTWTYAALLFRNASRSSPAYYLSIGRGSGGKTQVKLIYATAPTSTSGESLVDTTTTNTYSTSTIYHLWVELNGPSIDYAVYAGSTLIASGTVTDTRSKTGGPGFRLSQNDAYFDNLKICTLP
jgi:prepilin-type N-terminal cleavage/methylation domain-containing protein